MAAEGGSAQEKAEALRRLAAEARLKADRMDSMAARWEAGVLGERRVAAALAPLEGRHCRVLHDRLLAPGQSRVNLDHIVVSVAGTYLIDAKNFAGTVVTEGGSLRQRAGSRRSLDDKVDKVRRMAEELESRTTSVIDPVICLAGENSEEFGEPVAVRGVFVVPVGRLAAWLLARPRRPAGADLDAEAARLAAIFPAATGPAATGPVASWPAAAGQPVPPVVPMLGRRNQRQPVPRPRRRSGPRHATLVKLLVCLAVVLSLLTTPGQRLWWSGASAVGGLVASRLVQAAKAPASPPARVAPCSAVTDTAVAAALGQRVYRYVDGPDDTCSWGLVPRPDGQAPGILRIATGWAAVHTAYPTGPVARYSQTATAQILTVPQLAAVPGSSLVPTSITQPMLLVLSWKATPLTPARARLAITALAAELARHLPAGPGALLIVRHKASLVDRRASHSAADRQTNSGPGVPLSSRGA